MTNAQIKEYLHCESGGMTKAEAEKYFGGYVICYVDHRSDSQSIRCTSFEDAENICLYLVVQPVEQVTLDDGYVIRRFN